MTTITIERLKNARFFEKIDAINALISDYHFKHIYLSPPIRQPNTLYLMLDCSDNDSLNDFLAFSNSIHALLEKYLKKEGLKLQVFDIFAAEKVVIEEEDSDFYLIYKRALDESILIDKLSPGISLELQWKIKGATKSLEQNSPKEKWPENTPASLLPTNAQPDFILEQENRKRRLDDELKAEQAIQKKMSIRNLVH